jgi:hypothetical protein
MDTRATERALVRPVAFALPSIDFGAIFLGAIYSASDCQVLWASEKGSGGLAARRDCCLSR